MTEAALVAMRLEDMARVHPGQDNSRSCSRCGRRVGIYPSGRKALAADPDMAILCQVCALKGEPGEIRAAASWPEIFAESRASKDKGR